MIEDQVAPKRCGHTKGKEVVDRATAVARASRAGHTAALAALLEAPGADPNLCNDKLQSPLHFAAFKRQPEAAALLLAHPACDPFVLDRKEPHPSSKPLNPKP